MSKVDDLREKYPSVTTPAFNKFVMSDKTPTKKYLEFYLKTWTNRKTNNCPPNTATLIYLVDKFDELIPYISNKDIYHKDYSNIFVLKNCVSEAEQVREEKTFVKEDHVFVLDETETYILIHPKTHRGSLKYGANTKWCTASKNNPSTFNSYVSSGCLLYLIDKTGKRGNNCEKIAFYHKKTNSLFTGVEVYNMIDTQIFETTLITNGWTFDELNRVNIFLRSFAYELGITRAAKKEVMNIVEFLNKIDFESLKKNIAILENSSEDSYLSNAQEVIKSFVNKIKTI